MRADVDDMIDDSAEVLIEIVQEIALLCNVQ